MRTCTEVFQYMSFIENKGTFARGNGTNSLVEGHGKVDYNENPPSHHDIFWLRNNLIIFMVVSRVMNCGQDQGLLGGEVEFAD